MCALVRCTAKRTATNWWIFRRVCEARLSLAVFLSIIVRLLLLGFLEDHLLVRIAHALALVGLGSPVRPHFRSDLADQLLVQSLEHDFRLRGGLHFHTLG